MVKKRSTTKKTTEEKKQARVQRKTARKTQLKQLREAFAVQRRDDKKIIPILLGVFLAVLIISSAIGYFLDMPWLGISLGILLAILAGLITFGRRAKKIAYAKADGQVGAGAYVLENLRGAWRVTVSVAANSHFDIVHRVIGLPGIILVGEGNTTRVKNLISTEKRSLSKIVGSVPIYPIVIGNAEGNIPLADLEKYLKKLPKNIDRDQLTTLENKLSAMKTRIRPPHGPVPPNARIKSMQRSIKRK